MDDLARLASETFGLTLTPAQLDALGVYERELLDWSGRFNLTAIRDVDGIRRKHFLDSLSCALAWGDAVPGSLIDVGTGAGFPGLVLKILYPDLRLALVESVGKKASFCRHVADLLGMGDVTVLTARAEEAGRMPEHRAGYDWAVARAVAALPVLCEYLLPLTRVGGCMLAQKGTSGPRELAESVKAMALLGARAREPIPVRLPGVDDGRWLIVIEKVATTPEDYPRRTGVPAKSPL